MADIRVRPRVAFLFVLAIAWAVFNAPIAAQAPAAPQQPETFPRPAPDDRPFDGADA